MTENAALKTRTYTVTGMTCGHCVSSVVEAVGEIASVQTAHVDLACGQLTVVGEGVDEDTVRAAVARAGYEVTS